MGAQVRREQQAEIRRAEADLGKLNDELKLDLAQAAVDVAGIADPTPISDAIGAGLSLYRGDFIGAGLSLISAIPYAGDALGKTAKGARLTKKINNLRKRIAAGMQTLNAVKAGASSAIRRRAAAAVRARLKKEAADKAARSATCKPCAKATGGNRFGTQSPKDGWVNGGERGNSSWKPADPNSKAAKEISEVTGGRPVQFREGFPVFTPYAKRRVEINMRGDHYYDFKAANKAAGFGDTAEPPKGFTWHHHEDGVTMELVPQKLHNNVKPHTGGASIAEELSSDVGY